MAWEEEGGFNPLRNIQLSFGGVKDYSVFTDDSVTWVSSQGTKSSCNFCLLQWQSYHGCQEEQIAMEWERAESRLRLQGSLPLCLDLDPITPAAGVSLRKKKQTPANCAFNRACALAGITSCDNGVPTLMMYTLCKEGCSGVVQLPIHCTEPSQVLVFWGWETEFVKLGRKWRKWTGRDLQCHPVISFSLSPSPPPPPPQIGSAQCT